MAKPERIFGVHTVRLLLQRFPERVLALSLLKGRRDERITVILTLASKFGVAVDSVDRKTLDRMTDNAVHQGVVATVRPTRPLTDIDLGEILTRAMPTAFFLVLDGIQDPHNLGACLRTADACGIHAVIAPRNRASGLTPAARKVASGAAETVPFIQVTNLVRTLNGLKESGITVVGLAGEGNDIIFQTDLSGALALVIGAEAKGMRRMVREACDALASLPMAGAVESLNASVAAAVCLYEAVRQRSQR